MIIIVIIINIVSC